MMLKLIPLWKTRPPLFNGNNYAYLKIRIRNFIISADVKVWKVIKDGPHISNKTIDRVKSSEDSVMGLAGKMFRLMLKH